MQISLGTLRELIDEAAVSSSAAGKQGLGIHMFDGQGVKQVVIYDTAVIVDAIVDAIEAQEGDVEDAKSFVEGPVRQLLDPVAAIKGTLMMAPPKDHGNCHGAWMVKSVAADKGYGPLVYDIAMGLAPNGTMMADRFSTSPSASAVWKYYKEKRSDVMALPLDDMDNPRTPPTDDDCHLINKEPREPWLNHAYRAQSKVDVARMKKNHEKMGWVIEKVLDNNGIPSTDAMHAFNLLMTRLSSELFFVRYVGEAR